MAEGKGTHTVEQETEPTKRPPWWKRLWGWTEFGEKTGWQWLELLSALAIPVVLTVAGFWFAAQQEVREDKRAKLERELEEQRAQDAALQAYLDQMSQLLLEKDLRNSEEENDVRILADARTVSTLRRLEPSRKAEVVQFLIDAELAGGIVEIVYLGRTPSFRLPEQVVRLGGADLSGVNLNGAELNNTYLSHADLSDAKLRDASLISAILEETDLSDADLSDADLSSTPHGPDTILLGANLTNANLSNAALFQAVLRSANLSRANLSEARLGGALLSGADLSGADLRGADLSDLRGLRGADLSGADLSGAEGVTKEELEAQAKSLKGATMPDGSKHD